MPHRDTIVGCVTLLTVIGVLSCGGTDAPGEGSAAPAATEPDTSVRNPFGFEDVVDCCGPEVQAFADANALPGGAGDENAESWTRVRASGGYESIDGEWSSRWKIKDGEWSVGTATIQSRGDTIFIHYRDVAEYLLEGERKGNRLVGRYISQAHPTDTSPWVGTIVSNDRIDGVYLVGRWDFRRGAESAGRE
jgi:hypothetical protein